MQEMNPFSKKVTPHPLFVGTGKITYLGSTTAMGENEQAIMRDGE